MVCLTCGRVRPASKRSEYTTERGALVAERGLCICATPSVPCARAVQSIDLPPEAPAPAEEGPALAEAGPASVGVEAGPASVGLGVASAEEGPADVSVLLEDRPVEALTDELSPEPVTSAESAA